MIVLDLSILNQKGTPMFNSDTLANRPAAGIVGRIFIAIDSPFGIYRDTGTAWDQISGASTFSGSLATGQVAFGSATNTISGTNNLFWDNANGRLGVGTNTPQVPFQVYTFSNISASFINGGNGGTNFLLDRNNSPGNNEGFSIAFRRSDGSPTSPTNTGPNRGLGMLQFYGYHTGDYRYGAYIQGIVDPGTLSSTSMPSRLVFATSNSGTAFPTEKLQINNLGNVIIQNGGSFVDGGQRLQVQGTTLLNGTTTINSFLNISSFLQINGAINSSYISGIQTLTYYSNGSSAARAYHLFTNGPTFNATIENIQHVLMGATFGPTSGISEYSQLSILPTINQTGGANGITRGLLFSPTLTAAANWRSIEWLNNTGWGLYGTGTALNYLGGTLGIKTTSPYSPSTFSLDVNGGLLVKNTAGTTAQITLINANPALGGNEGFLVTSVGGTSGTSYAELQGYYGLSVTGSTALRLNPAGGAVIVNSTTNSGEQFQLTGTLRINGQQSATSGGNSGQHLIINLDGTQYKIKLELP